MGARCHKDTCSISWNEVVEGGVRKFEASARLGSTLECSDADGLNVRRDPDSVPWFQLDQASAPGEYAPLSGAQGIWVGSEFAGPRLIKHIAYSDTPASNPFAGLAADSEAATPDYGSGNFSITNDTGREGLLLITGMYELYYDIRAGLPISGDSRVGKIVVPAQTSGVVGSTPELAMTPYNAQISMGLVMAATPSPTYAGDVIQRHEFDISGIVNAPPTEGDEVGRQYKSSKAAFAYQVNIPGNATRHWRCFAFFNGASQTSNISLTPFNNGSPRRGFRISEVTASIIPIPVNEEIQP